MSGENGYYGSPYEQPPSPTEAGSSPKIFIGGLSPSVTAEGLIAHFAAYGEVIDATIMNDKITGRPRGFGFVTFRNPEAVDALLQESHVLDGKQVECKRAVPMGYAEGGKPGSGGAGAPPSSRVGGPPPSGPTGYGGAPAGAAVAASGRYNPEKIFVGGLPISCDDNKLREYFSKYGVIVDAVVMIDRDLQRHRGFGYVLFQDASAVDAAVADHEAHQIDGKWVDVKRCVVQENAGPQSGPMRKGGKGAAPMPSGTMPGYYGAPRPVGYGGADYGTSQYYGKGSKGGKGYGGVAGGYMTSAYQPGYGYAPADPYASSGYGAAAPSPYGAMPGYTTSAYGSGYGQTTPSAYGQPAPGGYGQPPTGGYGQAAPSGYGAYMQQGGPMQQQPPSNAGAANPNDLYAASRRSGYRTSPY